MKNHLIINKSSGINVFRLYIALSFLEMLCCIQYSVL